MKTERSYPKCIISAKGTDWVKAGHPWIYEGEVVRREGDCPNGGLVDAFSGKGRWLGTGFLSEHSKIRVRLISRNANEVFDAAFWKRRIQYAWNYRKTVMDGQTDCCRLIFGEADGFPGLTVDRFRDLLVTQTLSVGIENLRRSCGRTDRRSGASSSATTRRSGSWRAWSRARAGIRCRGCRSRRAR